MFVVLHDDLREHDNINRNPHEIGSSPSLPTMLRQSKTFHFWSQEEDSSLRSPVQPEAVSGLVGVVHSGKYPEQGNLVGSLCINFTVAPPEQLRLHFDLLSRWLPALAGRLVFTILFLDEIAKSNNLLSGFRLHQMQDVLRSSA